MEVLNPSVFATAALLFASLVACVCITARYAGERKQVRLEDAPSQEEVDAARMAEEMDGVAVKREEYEERVRLSRSLLVLLATLAIALSLAEVGFEVGDGNKSWLEVLYSTDSWPVLSGIPIWCTLLYLGYGVMVGHHHWFAVLVASSLATVVFVSNVSLLVIPNQSNSASQLIHLCLSASATGLTITIPSGPRRVRKTGKDLHPLARVGGKGATVVSILWFTGAFPLVRSAQRKQQLDESDAPLLGSHGSSHLFYVHFARLYKVSKERSGSWLPTSMLRACWPLLRTIIVANRTLFLTNQILGTICGAFFYAPSYATFRIVSFLEESEREGREVSGLQRLRFGLPYCLLLAAATLVPSLLIGQVLTMCRSWLRMRIRAQLNTLIFAKTLRRKDASGASTTKGETDGSGDGDDNGSDAKSDDHETSFASKTQVVNLASVDSNRVSEMTYMVAFSMAPVEIATGGFFVIKLLGWSAVIGLATSFLFQPIIFSMTKLYASFEASRQSVRDRKVTLLNEVFHAIRMIKFNAWEPKTSARVKAVREEELRYQRYIFILQVAQQIVFQTSPVVVILVSYAWYTLVEKKPLTPSVAFTAMTVLEEMRYSLTQVPESLSSLISALVSVRRIQEYLDSDETTVPQAGGKEAGCTNGNVHIRNACIEWPRITASSPPSITATPSQPESAFSLTDVDISFAPNSLNLIVGKLGSGKTLLLRALLGEADVTQGSVSCPRCLPNALTSNGKLSENSWLRSDQTTYVSQTAFLINASLKDNILFGLPLMEKRYEATVDACGLLPDLLLLEDGDETEIGENGIGLSGGQKARVSLARAVYGRGATVLLDDCLSAVDAHTANHIHKQLLLGPLCKDRTVILVSHQVQLVAQSAEKVVMLEAGKVRYQGDPLTFMNSDLYQGLVEETEGGKEEVVEPTSSEEATPDTTAPPSPSNATSNLPTLPGKQAGKTARKLVTVEERAKGAVLLSIYAKFISAAGGLPFAIILVISFLLANGFIVLTSRWLQYWSSDALTGQARHSNLWWLTGWASLWLLELCLSSVKMALLFYGSLQASRRLFIAMLDSILAAPLRFHDTVSRGRLLNRFGYDFEESDSELAEVFERMGDEIITLVVNLSAVASGGGTTFLIVFALMVPVYVLIGRLYLTAVRDMKRLSSTTRSPILGIFSDVVSGVAVIRAFGGSDYFFQTLVKRIDDNNIFVFWTNELRWWYEQLFGTLSFFLILIASIIIVSNPSVGAARAGFVFSFLISTHLHLLFLLQAYTDVEQKLVSVERIVEYTEVKGEEEGGKQPKRAPAAWPHAGAVRVESLRVKYASNLPDVLKGISFSIPAGAKVAVVGPTGCGKSTLASSFFRFVEASAGSLFVDDVDLSTLALADVRSRLQIVPQDPIILSGPLRSSVDVQDEYSDEEVRRALRQVHLLDGQVSRASFDNLQHEVTEGGGNLSNGEKQLLCLARAVLRQSKLIIFDEATSSVDYDTDHLVSSTIREAFSHSTVLTIAHRLRTIIDYDYVIVMDDGQVVEYDSPATLLSDPSSRFYKLCKASGRRELAHLQSIASLTPASAPSV